ncbi:MAG: hypothetical protein GX625_06345 [Clostridiaceae bacterium]|nr:hypothetical protein [Clostridiaceae bacterium]
MAKKFIGYGNFFCSNCGERIEKGKMKCPACGVWYSEKKKYGNSSALGSGGIGWSDRINDSRFAKYDRNLRKAGYIWMGGLSIIIPAIMLATGDISLDKEGITVISVIIGVLWLFGLVFLFFSGRKKPDWDGQVVDKKIEQRSRRVKSGDDYIKENYVEFIVVFRLTDGSIKEVSFKDSQTRFDYYRIGDYVHFHGKRHLSAIEKYDKSQDEILFCIKCQQLNDARNNFCPRCGCPLLKGQPSK